METLRNTPKTQTFKTLIENLILTSQIEGKAERTIEQYVRVLYPFASFVNKKPEEVKPSDVRDYLNYLNKKGLKKTTLWTYHKELSVFYNFCCKEGYLKNNPVKAINKPRMPKIFPKTLAESEIQALFKAAKDTSFLAKRNLALLAIMFDSGLRASKVTHIKLDDVSLESQVVKVFGKGSKERTVPFSKETAKVIFKYLKARGNLPFEDRLFVTKHDEPLNRYVLCKTVKKLAKKAGIDPAKVSPHVLRHSFATNWIKAGGDAKRLQHILGHSDPRIVDVYVHLTARDLSEAHREYSPLSRVLGRG